MAKKHKIFVKRSGDDTIYVSFKDGTDVNIGKCTCVRLDDILPNYKGPMVNFDLNDARELVGIEILVFGNTNKELGQGEL